jgi:hypothetical protein
MSHEPEPIDADLLAALRAAAPLTEVPGDVRARVLEAVEGRITALPGPGGGRGGGGGQPGAASAPPTVAAPWSPWQAGPWLAVPAALVVGGLLGSMLRGPGPDRVVYVDRVVTSAASTAPSAAAPAPLAIPVESLPAATAPQARSAPAPADSGQQLAAESKLLDVARTSLAHGEADHALAAVDRHAAQFPRGMLSEEREALAVKALALAGDGESARARAAQFRARYPESLFLPAVEAALRSLR